MKRVVSETRSSGRRRRVAKRETPHDWKVVGAARGGSDGAGDGSHSAGVDPIKPRTKETGSECGAGSRQWSEAGTCERFINVTDIGGIAAQAKEVAGAVEVTGSDDELVAAFANSIGEPLRLEGVSVAPGEHGRLVVRVHDEHC